MSLHELIEAVKREAVFPDVAQDVLTRLMSFDDPISPGGYFVRSQIDSDNDRVLEILTFTESRLLFVVVGELGFRENADTSQDGPADSRSGFRYEVTPLSDVTASAAGRIDQGTAWRRGEPYSAYELFLSWSGRLVHDIHVETAITLQPNLGGASDEQAEAFFNLPSVLQGPEALQSLLEDGKLPPMRTIPQHTIRGVSNRQDVAVAVRSSIDGPEKVAELVEFSTLLNGALMRTQR